MSWSDFDVSLVFVGEVNGDQFLDNGVAIALFVVFMFLVVILLAVSSLLPLARVTVLRDGIRILTILRIIQPYLHTRTILTRSE